MGFEQNTVTYMCGNTIGKLTMWDANLKSLIKFSTSKFCSECLFKQAKGMKRCFYKELPMTHMRRKMCY